MILHAACRNHTHPPTPFRCISVRSLSHFLLTSTLIRYEITGKHSQRKSVAHLTSIRPLSCRSEATASVIRCDVTQRRLLPLNPKECAALRSLVVTTKIKQKSTPNHNQTKTKPVAVPASISEALYGCLCVQLPSPSAPCAPPTLHHRGCIAVGFITSSRTVLFSTTHSYLSHLLSIQP